MMDCGSIEAHLPRNQRPRPPATAPPTVPLAPPLLTAPGTTARPLLAALVPPPPPPPPPPVPPGPGGALPAGPVAAPPPCAEPVEAPPGGAGLYARATVPRAQRVGERAAHSASLR